MKTLGAVVDLLFLISPKLDTITRAHRYLHHCVFSD